ncbi:MAG TPA: porin [Methylococcaceae bacterium]|jgi:hypothetical protein|nr:porin [Methylococcaceae bacterium]HIA44362.1 porin [Methylococcaceae bacterium]HIO45336.1 porin [Methylococcales bacterium]
MKRQLLTSAIAGCFLAASGAASAGGAVEALTGTDINGTKITKDLGIDVGGWVSAGFSWNTGDPADNSNGPVTFANRDLEFQMNQLNLFISEEATAGDNYDLGFRADVMFGTDPQQGAQAPGLDTKLFDTLSSRYDIAIPQLYAELYAPIGNGVTIKAGHFYTIIGNEVVTSPDNFFYTHAYTMQYGEPFTHTGFLAETALTDSINFRAGAVNGWDNFNSVDDDAWSYIGGADWTSADGATSLTVAAVVGDVDGTADSAERWVYSVVGTHDFSDSLHLLIQHDQGEETNTAGVVTNNWYGINSYITYDVSDTLGVAVRGEWFQDGGRITAGNQGDYYGITGGVNYHVNNWLKVRPEVRYDWSSNDGFDAGTKDDQLLVSIDTVITF